MIDFDQLGCTSSVRKAFKPYEKSCTLGRVVSLDRGYPLVNNGAGEFRAELATTIKKRDDSIVAVGDWVALRLESGHEKAIIQEVLPRATEIARIKRVGREKQVRRQVLAANVDVVFICQSLTGSGLDERLLMRQMVAVCGCKATPVFVLTKCDDVEQTVVNDARERCAELAPNIALVCLAQVPADACPEGVQTPKALRQFLPAGSTALLLGESGVGKSTLTNALVGEEVFATGSVRERDDKGRHTTVARRMVQVPGAGLLIDAPGLRTMQILDLETGLSRAFPEIGEYAQQCRFANCSHTSEPGCEVREHVLPDRLNVYLHLSENRL